MTIDRPLTSKAIRNPNKDSIMASRHKINRFGVALAAAVVWLCGTAWGASGDLVWAKGAGAISEATSWSVTTLTDGNVVITGHYKSSIVFGAGEPNETTLVAADQEDIFIAKYTMAGALLWAKSAGGMTSDYGYSIAAMPDLSTVITGRFSTSAIFGQGEISETTLIDLGDNDLFIAKYEQDGSLAWAKKATGLNDIRGESVSSFSDGTFVVTGSFYGTATFGPGEPSETIISSAGGQDCFIAKYASDGSLLWVKTATGSNNNNGYSVKTLSDNTFFVTGYCSGTTTFGAGEPNETVINSIASTSIFIAKYNSSGSLEWVKKSEDGFSFDVTTISDGSAVCVGYFNNTSIFGFGEVNETTLISSGNQDVFIAKYANDGSLVWAKKAGGVSVDMSYGVTSLSNNSVCIIGNFADTTTFGAGEINETHLSSMAGVDIFIANYSSNGDLLWANPISGSINESGHAIATISDGSIYVTGEIGGSLNPAIFAGGKSNETWVYGKVFLAKYDTNTYFSISSSVIGSGGTITPDGAVSVVQGGSQSFTITPDSGYGIDDVLVDGSSVGALSSYQFSDVQANHTISASFEYITSNGDLVWAKSAGGGEAECVAIFSDETIVTSGVFYATSVFGAGEVNETSLITAGSSDIFVAKYSSDGSLVWAKKAGSVGNDHAYGIVALPDGSSVVTGHFSNTAVFGLGELNETSLVSNGGVGDIFVAKYASDGSLIWAKSAGDSGNDGGMSVAAFSDSSIAITGWFEGSSIFGSGEINETLLVSSGGQDIFIARYATDGSLIWAKRAGGTSYIASHSVSIRSDVIYITGSYIDTAVFGLGELEETSLTSPAVDNLFLAKYDINGILIWAKSEGGLGFCSGWAVVGTNDGGTCVTGNFQNTATFGSGEPNETLLTSIGDWDIFVARFAADGSLNWAKSSGGTDFDRGWSIDTLPNGSFVLTGFFKNSSIFGSGETNEITLSSGGDNDIFIANYASDGSLIWAKQEGSTGLDTGYSVQASSDSILVAGRFQNTVTFGTGESNETILSSVGGTDIFLAKYSTNSTFTISASVIGSNGTINPSGSVVVTEGANQFFFITPDPGYKVKDVVVDGSAVGRTTFYVFNNVTENHSISASFIQLEMFTITASVIGTNGAIDPSGTQIVTEGDNSFFNFIPDSGYVVDNVMIDGMSFGPLASYTFWNVGSNHIITVTFKEHETGHQTGTPDALSFGQGIALPGDQQAPVVIVGDNSFLVVYTDNSSTTAGTTIIGVLYDNLTREVTLNNIIIRDGSLTDGSAVPTCGAYTYENGGRFVIGWTDERAGILGGAAIYGSAIDANGEGGTPTGSIIADSAGFDANAEMIITNGYCYVVWENQTDTSVWQCVFPFNGGPNPSLAAEVYASGRILPKICATNNGAVLYALDISSTPAIIGNRYDWMGNLIDGQGVRIIEANGLNSFEVSRDESGSVVFFRDTRSGTGDAYIARIDYYLTLTDGSMTSAGIRIIEDISQVAGLAYDSRTYNLIACAFIDGTNTIEYERVLVFDLQIMYPPDGVMNGIAGIADGQIGIACDPRGIAHIAFTGMAPSAGRDVRLLTVDMETGRDDYRELGFALTAGVYDAADGIRAAASNLASASVWIEGNTFGNRLRCAVSLAGATTVWRTVTLREDKEAAVRAVDLVIDNANIWVFWIEQRNNAEVARLYMTLLNTNGVFLDGRAGAEADGIPISFVNVVADSEIACDLLVTDTPIAMRRVLVAWTTDGMVYARRMSAMTGAILDGTYDTAPLALSSGSATAARDIAVKSNGVNRYLVAWSDNRTAIDYNVYGCRVQALDGAIVDAPNIDIATGAQDQFGVALEFGDAAWLAAYTVGTVAVSDIGNPETTYGVETVRILGALVSPAKTLVDDLVGRSVIGGRGGSADGAGLSLSATEGIYAVALRHESSYYTFSISASGVPLGDVQIIANQSRLGDLAAISATDFRFASAPLGSAQPRMSTFDPSVLDSASGRVGRLVSGSALGQYGSTSSDVWAVANPDFVWSDSMNKGLTVWEDYRRAGTNGGDIHLAYSDNNGQITQIRPYAESPDHLEHPQVITYETSFIISWYNVSQRKLQLGGTMNELRPVDAIKYSATYASNLGEYVGSDLTYGNGVVLCGWVQDRGAGRKIFIQRMDRLDGTLMDGSVETGGIMISGSDQPGSIRIGSSASMSTALVVWRDDITGFIRGQRFDIPSGSLVGSIITISEAGGQTDVVDVVSRNADGWTVISRDNRIKPDMNYVFATVAHRVSLAGVVIDGSGVDGGRLVCMSSPASDSKAVVLPSGAVDVISPVGQSSIRIPAVFCIDENGVVIETGLNSTGTPLSSASGGAVGSLGADGSSIMTYAVWADVAAIETSGVRILINTFQRGLETPYLFTGETSSDYATASNWRKDGLVATVAPGSNDDVIIDGSLAARACIASGLANAARNVRVSNGGILRIAEDATLSIGLSSSNGALDVQPTGRFEMQSGCRASTTGEAIILGTLEMSDNGLALSASAVLEIGGGALNTEGLIRVVGGDDARGVFTRLGDLSGTGYMQYVVSSADINYAEFRYIHSNGVILSSNHIGGTQTGLSNVIFRNAQPGGMLYLNVLNQAPVNAWEGVAFAGMEFIDDGSGSPAYSVASQGPAIFIDLTNDVATASSGYLNATDFNLAITGIDPANFTLALNGGSVTWRKYSLEIISPLFGDVWRIGDSPLVQYNAIGYAGDVLIELDRDGDFNGGLYPTETLGSISSTIGSLALSPLSGAMTQTVALRIRSTSGAFNLSDTVSGIIIDDGYEPNDDALNAVSVAVGASLSNLIAFDEDWYSLSTTSPGVLSATVRLDAADAAMGMELWSFNGSPSFVSTSVPVGGTGRILTATIDAPSGIYLIRVFRSGGGLPSTYGFDSTFSPASLELQSPDGGELWILGQDAEVSWSAANLPGYLRVEVSLSGSFDGSEYLFGDGLAASGVALVPAGWTTTLCGSETARVRLVPLMTGYETLAVISTNGFSIDDDSENNDMLTTATLLPDGGLTGRVHLSADDDWYRFALSAIIETQVDLSFIHSDGDLVLSVYAPSGSLIVISDLSETGVDGESVRLSETLIGTYGSGTYYAKVSGAFNSDYAINVLTFGLGNIIVDDSDWRFGQTGEIRWTALGTDMPLNVFLSRRGDFTDNELIASCAMLDLSVSGSMAMAAPGWPAARVRLSATDSLTYWDSAPFVIDDNAEPNETRAMADMQPAIILGTTYSDLACFDTDCYRLVLADPNTIRIHLSFTNANGDLDLELLSAGGSSLAASKSNANVETIETLLGAGTYYVLVRPAVSVSGSNGNGRYSLSTETVAVGTISLTAPLPGFSVVNGDALDISWTSANLSGEVTILLSRDGGSNWSVIAQSLPVANPTYQWIVRGPPSPFARFAIVSLAQPAVFDASGNGVIRRPLSDGLMVDSPNGGIVYPRQTLSIRWTAFGSAFQSSSVEIAIKLDSDPFVVIEPSMDNSGQYDFLVPTSYAGRMLSVRVRTEDGLYSAVSASAMAVQTVPADAVCVLIPNVVLERVNTDTTLPRVRTLQLINAGNSAGSWGADDTPDWAIISPVQTDIAAAGSQSVIVQVAGVSANLRYGERIALTESNGGTDVIIVSAFVYPTGTPLISLSDFEMHHTAFASNPGASVRTMRLKNVGTGSALSYALSAEDIDGSTPVWLTVTDEAFQASGSLNAGGSMNLILTIDSTGLPAGRYESFVIASDSTAVPVAPEPDICARVVLWVSDSMPDAELIIVSPSDTSVLTMGNTATIRWDAGGVNLSGSASILLSVDGGSRYVEVLRNVPLSTSSVEWRVSGEPTPCARLVLVPNAKPEISAFSFAFEIQSPTVSSTLSIVRPYLNETICAGQSAEIRWSATGDWLDAARLIVRYSKDSGANWREVSVIPNTGSTWFTPTQADVSNQAILRIENESNSAQKADVAITVAEKPAGASLSINGSAIVWRRALNPLAAATLCETPIELSNCGQSQAEWSATADTTWVSSYPSNGVLAADASTLVRVMGVPPAGETYGSSVNGATVSLSASGSSDSTVNIVATTYPTGTPLITLMSNRMDWTVSSDAATTVAPLQTALTLRNDGTGSFDYTIRDQALATGLDAAFIDLGTTTGLTGTLAPGATLDVPFSLIASGLPAGASEGWILIDDTTGIEPNGQYRFYVVVRISGAVSPTPPGTESRTVVEKGKDAICSMRSNRSHPLYAGWVIIGLLGFMIGISDKRNRI